MADPLTLWYSTAGGKGD